MSIDFVMTFPCYVAMRTPVEPWTFAAAHGNQAIAVHTDSDLLQQFFTYISPKAKTLYRLDCQEPTILVAVLRQAMKTTSNVKPITHVLIDPTDASRSITEFPLGAFVRHLQSAAAV